MIKINKVIILSAQILNGVILFLFPLMLAKFSWWIIKPNSIDYFTNSIEPKQYDAVAKYITNRAPFGTISVKKVEAPVVNLQIRLTGIYLSRPSLVLIEVDKKPQIAMLNDQIIPGAILTQITESQITVLYQGESNIITLIQGENNNNSSNLNNSNNAFRNNIPNELPNSVNSDNINNRNNDYGADFEEHRRKILEELKNNENKANP